MKTYFQKIQTYAESHQDTLTTAAILTALVLVTVSLFVYLAFFEGKAKVVFEPTRACDLFEASAASELLGQSALKTIDTKPSIDGHVAVSQCGYTDGNSETEEAVVAALVVRSGIDSEGALQNKTEFAQGQPTENVVTLRQLGDGAYYDETKGQLNILDGKKWLLLSYGVGSDPVGNSLEDAVDMASVILEPSKLNQVPQY